MQASLRSWSSCSIFTLIAQCNAPDLDPKQFTAMTRTRAFAIDRDSVTVGPVYLPRGSNHAQRLPADTVVFVSLNRPARALHDALVARGVESRLIGDALSPRFLETAIRDGHVAGAAV